MNYINLGLYQNYNTFKLNEIHKCLSFKDIKKNTHVYYTHFNIVGQHITFSKEKFLIYIVLSMSTYNCPLLVHLKKKKKKLSFIEKWT